MLAPNRHRQLLEILNEKGSVRTSEIAQALKVTDETIRRDFEKLEKDGFLLRAHGGAIRLDIQKREISVEDRASQNSAAKRSIAQVAAQWVQPGQVLFLDPSTTVQQLARLIPDQPLTIITSSLQIPHLFTNKPAVEVIVLGGRYRASSRSCTGYAGEIVSDLYRIDSAFISCRAIDAHDGLSEATEDQARLKRHLINRVSNLYLLADGSKVNTSSTHYFAKLSEVDVWFTDTGTDSDFISQVQMQNTKVEICPVVG